MSTLNKVIISKKLATVNENFTINMYDNGYMVEVGGRDVSHEWKTVKIIVSTEDELLEVIRTIVDMPRSE